MINFIKGIYRDSGRDYIIVENGGIGYKIYIGSSTFSRIGTSGRTVTLYTYLHVREDILALYGFLTKDELDMFELLIQVSGIGPKAGLAILSSMSPSKLSLSIMGGDSKSLTQVPGIGSKTAHRIILELKDKIQADDIIDNDNEFIISDGSDKEAVNALISLGYSAVEANNAINKLNTDNKSTEDIIKEALKNLVK